MEATIGNALYLLLIGMTTVFFILTLVIVSGRILISVVNKFTPEAESLDTNNSSIDPKTLEVISAAVKKLTGSRGEIDSVEKLG